MGEKKKEEAYAFLTDSKKKKEKRDTPDAFDRP